MYDWPRTATTTLSEFTGKERDVETGLDFFGARYLSAAQGRFTSSDPVFLKRERLPDPQRLNLYSYVRNDPLKFVDPTGEDLTIVVTAVAVGRSHVNHRPHGGLPRESAPTYRAVLFNSSGTAGTNAVTRDTNYNGPTADTRGDYGSHSETPPGTYEGRIRTDGQLGFRVQLYDPAVDDGSQSQLQAPDGTMRDNIALHIGPGCSEGCMLLTGGPEGRANFEDQVNDLLSEDEANGLGTDIHVIVVPRDESMVVVDDGPPREETQDEIKQREEQERQQK